MNYLKFISYSAVALQSFALTAMQAPSLSQFQYNAASVLPYVEYKKKPGKHYFLLGREAGGNDKDTWDAFGGSRDQGEKHPVQTASREFAEETIETIFNSKDALNYIDADAKHTTAVIANKHSKAVEYITKIGENKMHTVRYNFYKARHKATKFKHKEKNAIAFVREDRFASAIKNAQRDNQGHLKPVIVKGDIIKEDGSLMMQQDLTLRPYMVSTLQPYFQNNPYVTGKNSKIRFYN